MGWYTDMKKGARGFGRALLGGKVAGAKEPECPIGTVLTPTEGLQCLSDLVLDAETGDLVTDLEAARRQEERQGQGAPPLVWDEAAEEWVANEELQRRRRQRQQAAAQEAASVLIRPTHEALAAPTDGTDEALLTPFARFFDPTGREWVEQIEYEQRQQERMRMADIVGRTPLARRPLPTLSPASRVKISITDQGVATIDGKSASEVLADPEQTEEAMQTWWEGLTGALRRADGSSARRRALIVAVMIAIVVIIIRLIIQRRRG